MYGALVIVEREGEEVARRTIGGLGRFATPARDLRRGWGRFPDGAEVTFLCLKGDDCFGYAVNLTWPDESERGTRLSAGSPSTD